MDMEVAKVDLTDQDRVVAVFETIIRYVPIITTPIYAEAIYCIIKRCSNFQLHYTIILTAQVLGCFLEDFYGFQLLRPIVFLPVVGIYADGLLSLYGVHPFIQFYGLFLAFQINSAILTHITFYRLKVIIPMSYRHYSRVIRWGIFAIVFIYIGAFLSVTISFFLVEDQQEAKSFLYATLRPLPNFFWSEKYIVSTSRNPNVSYFLIFGAMCVSIYIFMCISLPTICFIILHKTKSSLSEKVIRAQKAYLKTILLQVLVVIIHIVIPLCVLLATFLRVIENPLICPVAVIFALLHGSASTLTYLISNKLFRDTVKAQLTSVWSFFTRSQPRRRSMVHTMSSFVG